MEEDLDFSESPKDYYFKMHAGNPQDPYSDGDFFSITPKSYFDSEGYLLDNELSIDNLLDQNGFSCLTDSTYNYENGDVNSGRQKLLSLWLIENNDMP
jgi:hypothetical protein